MTPNPRGQIINRDHSGGLGVCEMWCKLFRDNEIAAKSKRWRDVMTDKQIHNAMQRAFPDRHESKVLTLVQKNRGYYNSGRLFPMHEGRGQPPPFKSCRYERKDGRLWVLTPRGRFTKELEGQGETRETESFTLTKSKGGSDEIADKQKAMPEVSVPNPREEPREGIAPQESNEG